MKLALPLSRKRRETSDKPPVARGRKRSRTTTILAILIGISLLVGGVLLWRAQATPSNVAASTILPLARGNLDISVESSGTVQPAKSIDLPFQTSGQVREVLVEPGDRVAAGQPLARLDDRDLRLGVQQAEADLQTARSELDKARNGSATPQDLAQAQARLDGEQAALEKARTGNVTAADLREAEATLHAAQARLEALKNPGPANISAARLALTEAETNLQKARDDLSAAKTNAQLEMEKANAALTQAQSSYSTALQNWQYVQNNGTDPVNPGPFGLNDAQRQQYYDTYVQAEAALHSAEDAVTQAQVAYDTARQNEITGVQQAEAKVEDARQQLSAVMNPQPSDLAQAQAEVAVAQAQLDKLRQGGTRADVAAAQAQVDDARAALEKLTAPVAEADITAAQANVAQAQAQLDAAKLKLDNATLAAPFAATVAKVEIVPGSIVESQTAAVSLVDSSSLHLDVDLSESDIAQVKEGQPVQISFDTLPNQFFEGSVTSVAPTATEQQDVTTYLVQVQFDPETAPVKIGMTANANIIVERRQNVLLVPSRAIQSEGPAKTLKVLYGEDNTPITVRIEAGASDGTLTEIMRCPDTGNLCLREGDRVVFSPPEGSLNAGGASGGDMIIGPGGPAPGGAPFIRQIGP